MMMKHKQSEATYFSGHMSDVFAILLPRIADHYYRL